MIAAIELPAKCPKCFGDGCGDCDGGQIVVRLPADDWYTRHCTNQRCGFDNGACQGVSLYDLSDATCVMCGSGSLVWLPECEASFNSPWQANLAHLPFAQYLLKLYERPEINLPSLGAERKPPLLE